MKISLKGHNFTYEVSELLKAMKLGLEFSFSENDNSDDYMLTSMLDTNNDEVSAKAILIDKDNELLGEYQEILNTNNKTDMEIKKISKRLIKKTVYLAAKSLMEKELPWGILTGIRPTKIVHELMDRGKSHDEIKKILWDKYLISEEKIELMTGITDIERDFIYPIDEDKISIYISIPFCPTRCVYCSFPANPMPRKNRDKIKSYLSALYQEIDGVKKLLADKGKIIDTIYIGGGTPTSLTAEEMDELLTKLEGTFDLSTIREYTVEAGRPDTITKDKLQAIKKHGIERISINPQSMNPCTLELIGRRHEPEDIVKAFQIAREVGFTTINMDLIVGLPNEDNRDVKKTLEKIKPLDPENLTVHTLAIKKSSKLKESLSDFNTADDVMAEKMLESVFDYADKNKLRPYYMYRQKYMLGNLENVGFSKKGHEGIYNILIMEEKQTILALGAGGVSKFVYPAENRLQRVPNVKNVDEYIGRVDEMISRKSNYLD